MSEIEQCTTALLRKLIWVGLGISCRLTTNARSNVAEMTQQPGWGVFVKWNLHSIDVDTRAEVRSGLFERPIFFLGQPLHHGATAKQ